MNVEFEPLKKGTLAGIEALEKLLSKSKPPHAASKLPKGCVHITHVDSAGKKHYCGAQTCEGNGWLCFKHDRQVAGLPAIRTHGHEEIVSNPSRTTMCEECGRDVPIILRNTVRMVQVTDDHAEFCSYHPYNQAF